MARVGRIDLNVLGTFAAVAEAGGFTAAAERLGMAKAQVSLDVARLERQLGTPLFTRTTRRVALTDAGQALYTKGVPLVRGIDEALLQVSAGSTDLTGTLRLSTTSEHAAAFLSPAAIEFAKRHPGLEIDLRTGESSAALLRDQIDVAIGFGWRKAAGMASAKLRDLDQYVVASPAYLERAGIPRSPEELSAHQWIALTLLPSPLTWTFRHARGVVRTVRMNAQLKVDSLTTLHALLEQGAGFSAVDEMTARAALQGKRLVRVLNGWSLPKGGVYAVHPPGKPVAAKVRAFIDFYREYLRRKPAGK